MAERGPYALQILDALTRRDRIFAKGYAAMPLFNQLDNYAQRSSPFNRYPGMTDRVPKRPISLVELLLP